MRIPFIGALTLFAVLLVSHRIAGYVPVYQIAYGTLSLLAAGIAVTFWWLWRKRATPLAMGMVLSWAGGGSVMAWWWCYSLLGAPLWMVDSPALFAPIAFYLAGACIHFIVIGSSFGWPSGAWTVITGGALAGAGALSWLLRIVATM